MDDQLLDLAVMTGQIAGGASAELVLARNNGKNDALISTAMRLAGDSTRKAPPWTNEENAYLREQTGYLSVEEIGRHLGRTAKAVLIHRKRLGIPGPTSKRSKRGWLTANKVTQMLGISCPKTVVRLITKGIMPARLLPLNRKIYCVTELQLKRWLIRPENWIYFDTTGIRDPRLRRLVELKKEQWGDEWWATPQVAKYHGCLVTDVVRQIKLGKLPGVQVYSSKGSSWYVRRSDVMRLEMHKGYERPKRKWSDAGDAFLILAKAIGLAHSSIKKMGRSDGSSSPHRIYLLYQSGEIPSLIERHGLNVQYDPATRRLWADWREYAHRFPFLPQAIGRFLAGRANKKDLRAVRHVMISWLRWFGDIDDNEQRTMCKRLALLNTAGWPIVYTDYLTIQSKWGIDPFNQGAT